MSGAAYHLAWLGLIAALLLGAYGGLAIARDLGSGGRRLARRLLRARPPSQETLDGPPADEPLFAAIDRRLPWLARRLASAKARFTPSQVVLIQIAIACTLLLLLDLAGLPPAAALFLAALAGFAGPLMVIAWLAARRQARFAAQLPQAIDLIARSLQAGHPVAAAMAVAAQQTADPLGPELKVVITEINYGLDRDAALRNLAARFPLPELRMFAASLEITRETGGNVAEVLLGLADRLRQHAQLRKKVAALSAEGRLSFWVISALPLLAGGAILALRPQYYREVAADPHFWPMMSAPPLLLLAGGLIIWRLINFRV